MNKEGLRESIAYNFFKFDIRRWSKGGATGLPDWKWIKERPLESRNYYESADRVLALLQATLDEKDREIAKWKESSNAFQMESEEAKDIVHCLKVESQKRVEGIFREIESLATPNVLVYEHDGKNPSLVITMSDFQALKAKEGVE